MGWIKRAVWAVAAIVVVAGGAWLAWPRPILVDLAAVASGPIEVNVDNEGRTRVRHDFVVSAPVAGRLLRISTPDEDGDTSLHVGDAVKANETVVAVLQPTTPGLIDVRSREELTAAAAAAEAAVKLAQSEVERVQASLDFSRQELARAQSLAETETISAKALEAAQLGVATNEAVLKSTQAQLEVRRSELALANARLIDPAGGEALGAGCCIELRAPADGRILRIFQDSEGVVAPGTPLVEIGDPTDLEIVADLLSSDAVQVEAGAPVTIDGWGGDGLKGIVRRIEPEGFVKVSALGIEEQRVRTIIDLVDPPEAWAALGNNFRVLVHVRQWATDNALLVPVAALFRDGEDWAVFVVGNGTATTRQVTIGHRNGRVAEVLAGLSEGELVILHPSDRITDGVSVAQRQAE